MPSQSSSTPLHVSGTDGLIAALVSHAGGSIQRSPSTSSAHERSSPGMQLLAMPSSPKSIGSRPGPGGKTSGLVSSQSRGGATPSPSASSGGHASPMIPSRSSSVPFPQRSGTSGERPGSQSY